MPLKKSIKIGLIISAAVLLTVLVILGIYFIFFYGSNSHLEASQFDPNNGNQFSINRADDFNVTRAIRNVRRFLERKLIVILIKKMFSTKFKYSLQRQSESKCLSKLQFL